MTTGRRSLRRSATGAITAVVAAVFLGACSADADVASGTTPSSQVSPTSGAGTAKPTSAGPVGSESSEVVPGTASDATATTNPPSTGPAPSTGNIDQTVAPETPRTLATVALDETASFGNDVTLKIDKIESIDAEAKVPGEISGPAVVLDISVTNGTSSAIGLDSVAVTATAADGEPVSELSTDPAAPFSGVLEPSETGSAKYVFLIPEEERDNVVVTVQYAAPVGIVTLTGDL